VLGGLAADRLWVVKRTLGVGGLGRTERKGCRRREGMQRCLDFVE